jgi:hypothetical protein
MATHSPTPSTKVVYRPIEAAIRWCGLEQHEAQILSQLNARGLPEADEFPQWPELRLNAERIYDAVANHELPSGIDGITVHGGFRLDHPGLTVRHVDLRAWMSRFYPYERPHFLFAPAEGHDAELTELRTVSLERDELRAQLEQRERELSAVRVRYSAPRASGEKAQMSEADPLTARAESTYLHIIGVMLRLLVGSSPSGQRYSRFSTQESVVSAMTAHFGRELMGITERTLHAKFAAANRKLEGR